MYKFGLLSIALMITSLLVGCRYNKIDTALPKSIAHACGIIDGYEYTNSLEALEYNYGLGQRAFEIDFLLTSDEKLVLRHDWNDSYQSGIGDWHIPDIVEFKEKKIIGVYTPMDICDLVKFMKEHDDIIVITDTKYLDSDLIVKEFTQIEEALKEEDAEYLVDRFIVQIYRDYMLEDVRSVFPAKNIIFTMYQVWTGDVDTFPEICEFCKKNNIKYITMWYYLATDEILNIAKSYGIEVCVHTVNDREEAESYLERGVCSIYTDKLVLE